MTSMTERPIPDSEIRVIKPELPSLETKPAPEKWTPNFALIVISGPPGAGTSSLAKGLAELTGASLYKAGDTMRERKGIKERAPGSIKRNKEDDLAIDDVVRQMVIHASKDTPAIAEAQIGNLTALDTQREIEAQGVSQEGLPIIRILLTARKKVRDERIYQESLRRREADPENETNPDTGRFYTKEDIEKRNSTRAAEDLEWYRGLYPDLVGEDNPHHPGSRDKHGRLINHLHYDNSDQSGPEETLAEVLAQLKDLGYVSPKEYQMEPEEEVYLSGPRFKDRIKGLFSKNPDKKIAN